MAKTARGRRRYSTGKKELDQAVTELVADLGLSKRDHGLVTEIVTTALLMGKDVGAQQRDSDGEVIPIDPIDLKLTNAALKEMRYAFKVFAPYRDVRKVSIFGSSRSKPGDPDYEQAREIGRLVAERGWMVVTGAGPGSMAAANEGAGKAQSFGVNIRLPFEAEPNPTVADDPKLINFKYFFTRKLMFIKEASAFVLLPGGFGTMDEAFELLTLMQTGKSDLHPIVLLDAPGETYWSEFTDFVDRNLIKGNYASRADIELFTRTDDLEEAASVIDGFYANYHSMRFVGQRLVLRMKRAPGHKEIVRLRKSFEDLLVAGGTIEPSEPSSAELGDQDAIGLERLVLDFDRASYGRLRALIGELNRI
jgi:uncharacterized protein (TIGR00730 family)